MQDLRDESVNTIYLDPPFMTNKKQSLSSRDGEHFYYEDSWETKEDYIRFIEERLIEMHRVLRHDGSLFFHCDRNATHLIRFALDKIFGEENFISEIIWTYRRWSNSKKGLMNSHQTIYMYSKSDEFKFNQMYQSYSETTNIDQILQLRSRDANNKASYAIDKDGKTIVKNNKAGVPLSDVWDIPFLNPKAKERCGYPTQKPLLLLERIIEISTDVGDSILDPFCGSGTTLVAASQMGRFSIGIDIAQEAVDISRSRLEKPVKTESRLLEVGRDAYNQSLSELSSILYGIDYTLIQRNKGLDALLSSKYSDKPIFIRIQRQGEDLRQAIQKMALSLRNKGSEVSFLIAIEPSNSLIDYSHPNIVVINSLSMSISGSIASKQNNAKVLM
ncbi:hypothetical protein Dxin01_04007 [Deinococcus xinjiangensis]|uniref:Methyltransferase n=1 Tax=Deinococcus xinjiangensis TaxID=457454 RepID=A0ABP9VGA3_9DEIO